MKNIRYFVLICVLSSAWAVLLSAASQNRQDDVILTEGLELRSTVGEKDQRLIRDLIRSANEMSEFSKITIDYPMDGSIFPPEIAAPTFLWHDETAQADRWLFDAAFNNGKAHIYALVPGVPPQQGEIDERCISVTNELYQPTPYQSSARSWKPTIDIWAAIKESSVSLPATLTIYGYRSNNGTIVSRGRVVLSTSGDPVGAMIFYRDVPLMPSQGKDGVIKPLDQTALPLIAWRLKDISRPDSRVLLTDMPTCANCHSFSADGKILAMDVDGPDGDKGAYAIVPIQQQTTIHDTDVITWNAFKGRPKDRLTFGFLARISPDGRYVITTVNDSLYVRNFTDYRFLQVFYPTRGILAFHSRETGEIKALPGADDPTYVHCNPVWTPDGKTIIFSRAKARHAYNSSRPVATYAGDPNETQIQFDLYRIPFNEGKGGPAETISGASDNGMSNAFPKVSPDGKWIVFVKSKNGLLMRPDGKLWIVPVNGGEARQMQCNLPLMNSWHSFSPNGRWLVFSSKSNTPYTQMFLAHIDESGRASPAVLIENTTAANRAINIPEFVNISYDDLKSIAVPAVEYYDHFQLGNELFKANKYREALTEYEKALEGERKEWRVNDWKIYDSLSKVLLQLGDFERAEDQIHESLRLNPDNPEMYANLGLIMFERGSLDQAKKNMDVALRLSPEDPKLWCDRASIRLSMGDYDGGIEDYTKAIQIDPRYVSAYNYRGIALFSKKDLMRALADFNQAIMLDPKDPTPWYFRARIRTEKGEFAEALKDCKKALEVCPQGSPHAAEIKELQQEIHLKLDEKK